MKRIVLCTMLLLQSAAAVYAQTQAFSVDITAPRSFYTMQKQPEWCWAACNQMMLNAVGIPETQENQVVKLYGQLVNRGAGTNYELARMPLGGRYENEQGETVNVRVYISYGRFNDPDVIIDHLKKDIPLVMATKKHGRICVGADYVTDGSRSRITRVRLMDPAGPREQVVEYTMEQLTEAGLIGFMTIDLQQGEM
ncbi:MAG TPA: papain-like cysteine protease family protein [Chitinophaga sp.]|uniref:papain-like cysteine protease family protein n=1 Tax=Chitinophaga sp. TaxID=1869181 RepID=UPI002DBACF23|nr:papain-like cysteine protease family protein [Chitinophaga sp.]HEU4554043.1 papain-like cysteine protease family protein [Chitinophaga sp.]